MVQAVENHAVDAHLGAGSAVDHAALVAGLVPAVLAAGAALLRHRSAGVSAETKTDGSPVCAADREAEGIVLAALADVAASVPVIAEEACSAGQRPAVTDRAFLVDALDGTREFVAGGDDFTVNVALVVDGWPVFGIVFAPASGQLFATLGARRMGVARIALDVLTLGVRPEFVDTSTSIADPSALRVLTSSSHRSSQTDGVIARFPGAVVRRLGSSLKFGLVAAGEADIYPRVGPTCAWDIAAGHAVLEAAGGVVTTLDGKPLRYHLEGSGAGRTFINPDFVAWAKPSLVTAVQSTGHV